MNGLLLILAIGITGLTMLVTLIVVVFFAVTVSVIWMYN